MFLEASPNPFIERGDSVKSPPYDNMRHLFDYPFIHTNTAYMVDEQRTTIQVLHQQFKGRMVGGSKIKENVLM